MAIQFIIGSAGVGKSHRLYEMLVHTSIQNPDREYIAIVPEQYSMEAQKEIVSIHPRNGSFNTEVVGFSRLAYKVFEEMGLENIKIMDDLGRTLVLRRVLEACKKELKVYSKKITMPGFVEKIKSTLSEFGQYDISPKDIDNMVKAPDTRNSLKYKLHDINTIYEYFNQYIEEKMITQEEVLNLFCKYIPKSKKIANSELYIDGFTGFTPIQYNVLELLIKYAGNVTFAFTLPQDEVNFTHIKEQELFSLTKKTISDILNLAYTQGVKIKENIVVEKISVTEEGKLIDKEEDINNSLFQLHKRPYRLRMSEELSYMEENVFRYSNGSSESGGQTKLTEHATESEGQERFIQHIIESGGQRKISLSYGKECRDISIHIAGNPRKEAQFTASKIAQKMIEDSELRYSDIAVVTGDVETYYRYLEEAFEEYNIPAFIDHKRKITANPFVDAIKASIEMIEKDFSYESVFHYLRLGVTSLNNDNIDRLENYVLMSGRRGYKSYSVRWERIYQGITQEELELINESRQLLTDIMTPLRSALKEKNATVTAFTKAIYEFAVSQNMQEKLDEYATEFEEQGQKSLASEYKNTYAAIATLLDKVVNMLGSEVMSLKDYRGVLESGFENIKVGIIPPALDCVMVGDIERTRLKDVKKILFFIGVNDGIIPKTESGGGILSDVDREFLESKKFVLAPTARKNAFKQKLYLYATLTKPSEKLIITYSKSNSMGEELRKSYLVSVLQKMFTQLSIIDEDDYELSKDRIYSENAALRYIASSICNYKKEMDDNEFNQIFTVIHSDEKYREKLLNIIDAAFYKREDTILSEKIANMLYGFKDGIGITRIEQYAKCAYAQFLSNGLKLKQRRHYELASNDLGNLYHKSIDLFCEEIKARNIKWKDITEDTRMELVNQCVEKVVAEYDNDVLSSSARNIYITDRVRKVTDKTVKVLGHHLSKGEFEPKYYELAVTHGIIDRVDIYEKDNRVYIKVIDYKSGVQKFSLQDTFYGLQLQLMVYMNDVMKKEAQKNPDKTILPGGVFYYSIKNPYVDKPDFDELVDLYKKDEAYSDLTENEIKKQIVQNMQLSQFSMSGLVNSNEEALMAMDKEAYENKKESQIIPVKYTSKGISAASSVASSEQFNAIIQYVADTADHMREEIMNGNIKVNPEESACTYCPYANVCKFDTGLGDKYRSLEKLSKNQIFDKITGE